MEEKDGREGRKSTEQSMRIEEKNRAERGEGQDDKQPRRDVKTTINEKTGEEERTSPSPSLSLPSLSLSKGRARGDY